MTMPVGTNADLAPQRGRSLPPPPPPLQQLPLPLLLLVLAQSYHSQAVALHPTLCKPPSSSTNSHKRYTLAWISYRRFHAALSICLDQVVALTSSGGPWQGLGSGRVELRARTMLAECLASSGASSALLDKMSSRGMVASEKHDTLKSFTPHLALLQPSLSSSSKFARQTLRRLLSSPTTPVHWVYHLHITLANLPNTSYTDALASWYEVDRIATHRGDVLVRAICYTSIARLALAKGSQWHLVSSMLQALQALGPKDVIEKHLPSGLKVYALLIESLLQAHMGLIKEAKEKLKLAHGLLDRERAEGEEKRSEDEGWCRIPINPPDPNKTRVNPAELFVPPPSLGAPLPSVQSISISLGPRTLVYNFAFLASVAIHRDPFGSKPRSTLFANEGLKLFDLKLNSIEPCPPLTQPHEVADYLARIARMKIHLLLFSSELEIMRSGFEQAKNQLLDAVTTARNREGLWDEYEGRITLDFGMLFHAEGEDAKAEECYETVLDKTATSSATENDDDDDEQRQGLRVLAGLSLLMLKMSQGWRIRLSTHASSNASANPIGSPQRPTANPSNAFESPRYDAIAREIVAFTCAEESGSSSPSSNLIAEFIQSLTKGEITKSKQHLSVALQLSNQMNSNHAKALVLSLLANLFLMTRNDQAQKMLHAASHLVKGMGARMIPPATENPAVPTAPTNDDYLVGNARLGLWLGERLLESYKKENDLARVQEQERRNDAHRRALNVQRIDARV
ncbi:BQ5605_C001g00926 [Microbotryum silenes-dioicae]|uniref:BQ5605_C001g00926 protein n=1 Tax=Microbotryum silenes-dioicae TaxID=796604 RepID=A0A2X0P7E5_9BASI|nr:BQ5605_C001g00926 [Microbotryum silenes-dioicae]